MVLMGIPALVACIAAVLSLLPERVAHRLASDDPSRRTMFILQFVVGLAFLGAVLLAWFLLTQI
jgi:hypothetical protein